jgi:hypothetical protein
MDSIQHARNGPRLDATGMTERAKTRITDTSPTATSDSSTAELIRPISKSKHWKLLYASNQPENPDDTASSAEGSGAGSDEEEQDSSKHKGLCKNCKKRDSCQLPKPEGGVWRCEDYE